MQKLFKISRPMFRPGAFSTSSHSYGPAKLHHVLVKSHNPDKNPHNLIVLHGLLGSSHNFHALMKNKKISSLANSYLLDLRNHGDSEHKNSMTLPEMAHDVKNFAEENDLLCSGVVLLAHSFGARVAMQFALQYPDVLKGVMIVDMVPYNYIEDERFEFIEKTHNLLNALVHIDLKQGYDDIIEKIKQAASTEDIVGLLVSNLVSDHHGGYKWKANLKTIFDTYLKMQETVPAPAFLGKYAGPTKVICGEISDYTKPDILHHFKDVFDNFEVEKNVKMFKDAGHWLHYQKPHEFISEVSSFLQSLHDAENCNV